MIPKRHNRHHEFQPFKTPASWGVYRRGWLLEADRPGDRLRKIAESAGNLLRKGGGQGQTSLVLYNGRMVFCKVYSPSTWRRKMRDLLTEGRALREWRSNLRAERAGIRTARIQAAFTRREGADFIHYVLSEPAEGPDAATLLKQYREDEEARRGLLGELAHTVADFHHRGFFHAHLHCKHLFRGEDGGFTVIDLERCAVLRHVDPFHQRRNLRDMARSITRLLGPEEAAFFQRQYWAAFTSHGFTVAGALHRVPQLVTLPFRGA